MLSILGPGMILILVSVAGAGAIRWLGTADPSQPERPILLAAAAAAAGVIIPVAIYLGLSACAAVPGRAAPIFLAGAGTVLAAFYLTWVSYYVEYPADILMFAEGEFVNDIVKFRTGHPIYTAQQNNESLTYTPGAPLCTYALACAVGAPDSIPVYRLIQLVYDLGAAVAGVFCYVRLMQLSGTARFDRDPGLWGAIALPLFFLVATNSISNLFVHNLHNDALAQFMAVAAYWLLLEYAVTKRRLPLVLMALIPTLGFMVKQSLAIWAPLYCVYLLFFDSPRSLPRLVAFGISSFASLAAVVFGCYFLWGEPFRYWAFVVMGSYHVPLIRSIQHGLAVWVYYGAGFLAALVLLRGAALRRLLGPWVIWLLFFGAETYTSGLSVTLNHIGPGSLIAGIWFLAAVTRLWPAHGRSGHAVPRPLLAWRRGSRPRPGRCGIRGPRRHLDADQFPAAGCLSLRRRNREGVAGLPADRVLLDLGGAWLPGRKGVVTKDSSSSIGCRAEAPVGVGDFSGFLDRLDHHYYQKILVRNLDAQLRL